MDNYLFIVFNYTPPALNFAGSWFQLDVAYDSSVARSPGTPIRGNTSVRQAG